MLRRMLTAKDPTSLVPAAVELQMTHEVAALLRIKPNTLRDKRFRARIGLHPIYVGRRLRFRTEDVKRLIQRHRGDV